MSANPKKHLLLIGLAKKHQKLRDILVDDGYRVDEASSVQTAVDSFAEAGADLLLVDLNQAPDNGAASLVKLQTANGDTPIITLSDRASVNEAVQVMQAGAVDYLAMPVSQERLLKAVEFGLGLSAAQQAHHSTPTPSVAPALAAPCHIITHNPGMLALMEMVRRVANSDATVLITGESGTGKELLAAYVHAQSERAKQPFVAMNCAALPEELAESELFGHEKGAFTGALRRKLGRFELADKGTLLLDEIGEMPLNLQAKLLRVLQARVVDRVGGQAPVAVDTRIVATTNRDLKKMVAEGNFREDLFYRLKVLPFELPALRKRPDDIPLLVAAFIDRFREQHGRSVKGIAPDALERLAQYPWPGNIRELENTLERAVLISRGTEIQPEDLLIDEQDIDPGPQPSPGTTVKEMERRLILSTMGQVNANRTRAAEMLGISIRTLRNKLNEYRNDNPELFKAAG
jgi:two-component system response regulator FlrC